MGLVNQPVRLRPVDSTDPAVLLQAINREIIPALDSTRKAVNALTTGAAGLSDANPQDVGTTDPGTDTEASRSDHVHGHGNQLGGSLHALVIAGGAAGFMSGADKTKLDGITAGATRTLQEAYDASTQPQITLSAAAGGMELRDAAAPLGTSLWRVSNNAQSIDYATISAAVSTFRPRLTMTDGTNTLFDASTSNVQVGRMATSEATQFPNVGTKGAVELMPDDFTDSSSPTDFGLVQWSSTYTTDYVNNRFGGYIYSIGTYEATQDVNALNGMNLFVNQTIFKNVSGNAISFGRTYTVIDQPHYQAEAAACTQFWHEGFRSFPQLTRLSGGSLTITDVEAVVAGLTVNAGCTVTNKYGLRVFNKTGAGTLTNQFGVHFANLTTGATNTCIFSSQSVGNFIDHTGAAISEFAGDIHMNNGISLVLGSTGANRVELLRSAAGVMRMIGVGGTQNEGLDWDFDGIANEVLVNTSTAAGLSFGLGTLVFGASAGLDPTAANWQALFNPPAKTVTVGGDFARRLFSSTGQVLLNAAMTTAFTDTINEPNVDPASVGSAVNAGNVLIQTGVSFGTNRYGLLITTNPSGGTLNYALRVTGSTGVRIDGQFEHTGTLWGIFGATPTTQPGPYSVSNVTTDRTYDANATTLDEIADVLGTLIADLQSLGSIS